MIRRRRSGRWETASRRWPSSSEPAAASPGSGARPSGSRSGPGRPRREARGRPGRRGTRHRARGAGSPATRPVPPRSRRRRPPVGVRGGGLRSRPRCGSAAPAPPRRSPPAVGARAGRTGSGSFGPSGKAPGRSPAGCTRAAWAENRPCRSGSKQRVAATSPRLPSWIRSSRGRLRRWYRPVGGREGATRRRCPITSAQPTPPRGLGPEAAEAGASGLRRRCARAAARRLAPADLAGVDGQRIELTRQRRRLGNELPATPRSAPPRRPGALRIRIRRNGNPRWKS